MLQGFRWLTVIRNMYLPWKKWKLDKTDNCSHVYYLIFLKLTPNLKGFITIISSIFRRKASSHYDPRVWCLSYARLDGISLYSKTLQSPKCESPYKYIDNFLFQYLISFKFTPSRKDKSYVQTGIARWRLSRFCFVGSNLGVRIGLRVGGKPCQEYDRSNGRVDKVTCDI